nr:ATP synthase F0 subunit 8 [Qianguimon aflagellum]
MPQMSPLLWLLLFCFFIFSLFLFLMFNYFIKPFKLFSFKPLPYSFSSFIWKL